MAYRVNGTMKDGKLVLDWQDNNKKMAVPDQRYEHWPAGNDLVLQYVCCRDSGVGCLDVKHKFSDGLKL